MKFLRVVFVSFWVNFPSITCSAATAADIETIVVTASRTPAPALEVGSSFTVITGEELERRQVPFLAEILRDIPGFAVSRSGGPGSTTQIRVRGAEANHLLVLIDGVEANDLAQGSEYNFANLLVTPGIERIEVIRGPQSALWGSDALAGVINIITAPGSGSPSVSGFLESGSFATRRAGGGFAAGTDRYHFNLNGAVLSAGGSNISRQGDEDDGFEHATLSLNAGYAPGPDIEIQLTAWHTESANQFDDIDFFSTGLPVDAEVETETVQDFGRAQARLSLLGGRWEHVAGGAYSGTENDNFSGTGETGSGRGRKYRFEYQSNYTVETAAPWNSVHVLSFVIDHELEDFTQRGPRTPFGDPNQDLELDSTGIVGEYRFKTEDSLSLTAGVRHDRNSDFADATTLRVTGAWTPSWPPGTRLHAAYGQGSKNPTFSERFGFFAESLVPFIGNPGLKPEASRGWEGGIDQALYSGNVRLGVTYFHEELEDEIDGFALVPARAAFTAINLDGTSVRQGVEITAGIDFPHGLNLHAVYTYLDATQPDATARRSREIRRPRHVAGINVNYVWADDQANVNLNLNYNGEQVDTFFPPFPASPERVMLRSFTLVTLAASYALTEQFSVYGRIENLLNQTYEEVLGFRAPGIGVHAGIRLTL